MIEVPSSDWPKLSPALPEEKPCALVPAHVMGTGVGRIFVDDPSAPRALAAFTGGNLVFSGDPTVVASGGIGRLVGALLEEWNRVFIDAAVRFVHRLRDEIPDLWGWPRVHFDLAGQPPASARSVDPYEIRRLASSDADAIGELGADVTWISDTHGGAQGLAESGLGFAAWDQDRLVAVAASFFVGQNFEELAVVTEHGCRSQGLSTACASALIDDVRGRWRMPCWGTTPDNEPSLRVARKLGFRRLADAMQFGAGGLLTGSRPLD